MPVSLGIPFLFHPDDLGGITPHTNRLHQEAVRQSVKEKSHRIAPDLQILAFEDAALNAEDDDVPERCERQDRKRQGPCDVAIAEHREDEPGNEDEAVDKVERQEADVPPDEQRRHPPLEEQAPMRLERLHKTA